MKHLTQQILYTALLTICSFCLLCLIVLTPRASAAYNDGVYGGCAYGNECVNNTHSDTQEGSGDNARGEGGGQDQSLGYGGADSSSSGDATQENTNRTKNFVVRSVDAIARRFEKLSPAVQRSIPYVLLLFLLFIAILLLLLGLYERHKAAQVADQSSKLRGILKDRDNFLHVVVHNLNTPLAVARTLIETLQPDPQEANSVARLNPAIQSLASVINKALESSGANQSVELYDTSRQPSVTVLSTMSKRYFIYPVSALLILVGMTNIIQSRLAHPLTVRYLLVELLIAISSVVAYAYSLQVFRLGKRASRLASATQSALVDLSRSRQGLITELSGRLKESLDLLREGIRLIKNSKISLMLHDGMQSLTDIANKLEIVGSNQRPVLEQAVITAVLQQLLLEAQVEINQKGLHVQIDSPDNRPLSVFGAELMVVLKAVIDNAIRYNVPNGSIAISSRFTNQQVRITVDDTGRGMTEADVRGLFQPFSKNEDALTGDQAALGLSLYVGKAALAKIGGTLSVKSQEGRGTSVEIIVPASLA